MNRITFKAEFGLNLGGETTVKIFTKEHDKMDEAKIKEISRLCAKEVEKFIRINAF